MFNRKEYMKEYDRQYREKNKEYIQKYMKKYRMENKEQSQKYGKEWRKNNKEHIKELNKQYYKKNKEHINKLMENWRKENKVLIKEINDKYQKTEEGKIAKQRADTKRKAREREIINTLTSEEWLDILEEYDYKCAYCGCDFDENNMPTKDHIIPISKGGDNVKENIVPACRSCNCKKGNKLLNKSGKKRTVFEVVI